MESEKNPVVPAPGGKPVVLVVEDEPLLRTLAVDVVEVAGFEAIAASNAAQAISVLENRADVRIVFTDVRMPGAMDGIKLAQAIHDRWPPIQLIVTSGRDECSRKDMPDRVRFFAKPYHPTAVIAALRQMAA